MIDNLAGRAAPRHAVDPWPVILEMQAASIPLTAATESTDILFGTALEIMTDALPYPPIAIAKALKHRLSADAAVFAGALSRANALDQLTVEVIDHMKLTDRLSPQRARIFALLNEGATNQEIAATLCISPRTVKRHIYDLACDLYDNEPDVRRDRPGILRRAREIGVLICIPVALAGSHISDAIAALGA